MNGWRFAPVFRPAGRGLHHRTYTAGQEHGDRRCPKVFVITHQPRRNRPARDEIGRQPLKNLGEAGNDAVGVELEGQ